MVRKLRVTASGRALGRRNLLVIFWMHGRTNCRSSPRYLDGCPSTDCGGRRRAVSFGYKSDKERSLVECHMSLVLGAIVCVAHSDAFSLQKSPLFVSALVCKDQR